jgi:hypothetical protein
MVESFTLPLETSRRAWQAAAHGFSVRARWRWAYDPRLRSVLNARDENLAYLQRAGVAGAPVRVTVSALGEGNASFHHRRDEHPRDFLRRVHET